MIIEKKGPSILNASICSPATADTLNRALMAVVEEGTAKRLKGAKCSVAGKTGTAQNPHGKDNSVFICFAPKDNPKIAVAAYVENAGFGATWALPVASLMLEKYLTGSISPQRKYLEDRMLTTRFFDD